MRGIIMGCCALCGVGGGVYMGVGNSGIDYDGSVAQVRSQLIAMDLPDEFEESLEDSNGSVRVDSSKPDQIRWRIYVEGHEVGEVAATLKAVDADTTNVQVEWDPGDALPKGSSARAIAMQPFVEQVAETFVAEQIDATLEDREFNKRAVALQVAAYASTHPKEMKQYMAKMQALADGEGEGGGAEASNAMAGEELREDEARFDAGKPMTDAKPMTDLSKYR